MGGVHRRAAKASASRYDQLRVDEWQLDLHGLRACLRQLCNPGLPHLADLRLPGAAGCHLERAHLDLLALFSHMDRLLSAGHHEPKELATGYFRVDLGSYYHRFLSRLCDSSGRRLHALFERVPQ